MNIAMERSQPEIARVAGRSIVDAPTDLYIPPDALRVILEAFEGPLDLLLYLIRRQNLDVLDIPVAEITRQYVRYVDMMRHLDIELAADYLVMAAMLAEIKSRMLLPRPAANEEEEEDPRAELVRRLQEYERFKQAAEALDALPRIGRDLQPVAVQPPPRAAPPLPETTLRELMLAFGALLERAEQFSRYAIRREPLSVRARMSDILARIARERFVEFTRLFTPEEGRAGVVVVFLAILELLRTALLELVQNEHFAPIYLKATGISGIDKKQTGAAE